MADNLLASWPDEDIAQAEHRAWYAAARAWSDYRVKLKFDGLDDAAIILRADAESAEQVWRNLRDESARRDATLDINSPQSGSARTVAHR